MKWMLVLRLKCISVFLCLSAGAVANSVDTDRDGLPDDFEQALLVKFAPSFQISETDCDILPAEFESDSAEPRVKAKNGTIYGQVFPVRREHADGAWIEIHYFHLWSTDCGQASHPLDAESVSVLLRADRSEWRPEAWQAKYWYAAAHENTLCDMSNAATSASLNAQDHGPTIWVSSGKHASFLNKELCMRGCGQDQCDLTKPLHIPMIINLGERGAPMNGAMWTASRSWPLASKMDPHFTKDLLARIPQRDTATLVPARDVARGMRTTIKVAGNTYSSLASANSNTESAVESGAAGAALGLNAAGRSAAITSRKVKHSLKVTFTSTGKSLRLAFRSLGPKDQN